MLFCLVTVYHGNCKKFIYCILLNASSQHKWHCPIWNITKKHIHFICFKSTHPLAKQLWLGGFYSSRVAQDLPLVPTTLSGPVVWACQATRGKLVPWGCNNTPTLPTNQAPTEIHHIFKLSHICGWQREMHGAWLLISLMLNFTMLQCKSYG